MNYTNKERQLARLLGRFPFIKQLTKAVYQRLVYLVTDRPSERAVLSDDVELRTVGLSAMKLTDRVVKTGCFFGYYDRCPWNSVKTHYLVHRFAPNRNYVEIGAIELSTGQFRLIESSYAWSFQQGSMATWLPSDSSTIIFNTYRNGLLACAIAEFSNTFVSNSELRIINWPIQTVNYSGTHALTLNYRRLYRLRREYGYRFDARNFVSRMADDEDGIWHVDLKSGNAKLIITLNDLQGLCYRDLMSDANHKVNHIMYSPSCEHFIFMHRWLGRHGKYSRLLLGRDTCGPDGLEILMDEDMVSHYSWIDDENIVVWGRHNGHDGYYTVHIQRGEIRSVGDGILDSYGDGHPSFSPNGRWMITDTYPDKRRMRHLLLYDSRNNEVTHIGEFFAPWKYDGATRCDLHPRWSPDGTMISIDSAHEGIRRSYIVDVSRLVDA